MIIVSFFEEGEHEHFSLLTKVVLGNVCDGVGTRMCRELMSRPSESLRIVSLSSGIVGIIRHLQAVKRILGESSGEPVVC